MDVDAKPPYSQNWNVSIQRSLLDRYLVEVRYVGAAGSRLPRNVEANPAVYGPGATAQNADRRRIYANCPADGGTCDFSTIAMLRNITSSNFNSGQFSVSRRFSDGVGFNVSYWLSKSLDHLSAMNLSGAAAKPLAGENDLAQNPFDLDAEYGPSLFDARHRFVASASWEPPVSAALPTALRVLLDDWQINVIATHNSGTPFTVSDSANVALQANSPPISGFAASRPDVVGDPNAGPHTVDAWISRDAFKRLDPQTQAGQFGNAGRNIARAPGYTNVDLSLVRNISFSGDRPAAAPRRVVQRAQSPELRTAGRGSELGQLRAHLLGRPAAPDAVRGEGHVLDRSSGSRVAGPVLIVGPGRTGATRFFRSERAWSQCSSPRSRATPRKARTRR